MNIRILQKLVLIFTLIGTLSACATQWQKNEHGLQLKHARSSTLPKAEARPIQSQDLQAGDILFSANRSVVSLGVRLFNNAAVSHAFIYLGDGQIAEAVGSGVRIRPLKEALQESNLMAAFRYPDVNEEDILQLRHFAEQQAGKNYNYLGIAKQSTYSITRNVCELPIMPRHIRHFCLSSMATILITPFAGQGFFCSQFVI
ncbi:YiiX/YebB-like N1pC/P60 family cysteine hydrolase [Neisseria arctica]|uniref:YiiX/YebB-like N1pC/P60 family cysteine hydrolase n=1 Tax=Neisseria arctica TaxID=1470200 RepID=UPI00069AF91E|nr:YiiX/YebB-like N1pC/P60 family cysteine hydrolase [Neisseria arctica]UOO85744.1 NlpC/P60 family protein [Neisseria arctica]